MSIRKVFYLIALVAVLSVGYWLVSPLFIERRVSEEAPVTPVVTSTVMRQGTFVGLAGHSGEGAAKLVTTGDTRYLRFEGDFRVTNGPDLFVYLGKEGKYDPAAQLGPLKGNVGAQNYEIPPAVNLDEYTEVWVWCRAFSVPFASAKLQ